MSFSFRDLEINGLVLVTSDKYEDKRGYFRELNKKSLFNNAKINYNFVQDNYSVSNYGVIRGLHMQKPPYSQAKLVHVLNGEILDIAVDMRKSSPTFKEYAKINLKSSEGNSLFIPEGFAHGFCSLRDNTIVMYKNSKEYNKESELGLIWNDPDIGINWPIEDPIISSKDKSFPNLNSFLESL